MNTAADQITTVDQIVERARTVARAKPKWSKSRLARVAGLSQNALVDLFDPSFNPTAETLRKLEPALIEAETAICASGRDS